MGLANTGKIFIAKAIIDDSPIFFNNANAHIGVGDSDELFSVNQTDLQGSNKKRMGMEEGFPSRESNKLTFKSSFGVDEANFVWKEWGVFNNSTAGEMLNRKVEDLGTKQGGQWVLTVSLEIKND